MSVLAHFAVYAYIAILCCIGLIALLVLCTCLYIGTRVLIEKYWKQEKRPMATPMDIDELKLRRLAKSVRERIQTRRLANGR